MEKCSDTEKLNIQSYDLDKIKEKKCHALKSQICLSSCYVSLQPFFHLHTSCQVYSSIVLFVQVTRLYLVFQSGRLVKPN